ncbi:rap guanine nucleotide exchange factor 1-like isoform X4 [Ostrea edulis]|uniref:rap guanine nucleotide exchange factor 1-like isoform X4 n=1 Tax=Ostrea edulis TaxID=37623 RepID=UPI0024AFE409|nr:rap guanine nucleotide exchange factor 1-like isoform X4 [Ostrea edulis]
MSKPEKSPGAKMLKKARSFRDDVKGYLRRRSSASTHESAITEAKHRHSKSYSLPVETPLENPALSVKIKEDSLKSKNKDVDKLQAEVEKVFRSLAYIKAVVDYQKPQVIPNTATVILENVMDVFTLLNNFFIAQDSSVLVSRQSKVCQCLACFIQWADDILLHGDKELNKSTAHDVISALSTGVQELKEVGVSKLEDRKTDVAKQLSPESFKNHTECKRASLPDLPLTPREKEILDKTGEIGTYDNPNFPASRSQDSICSLRRDPPDLGELPPPPKPPLPKDPEVVRRFVSQRSQQGHLDGPPPLPEKENRQSLTDSLHRLGSVSDMCQSPSSRNSVTTSSLTSSPSQSPHNSMVFSGHSPHNSLLVTGFSPSQSPHNSVVLTSHITPDHSPHSSVILPSNVSSELSTSLGFTSSLDNSSASASSLGSGLNHSTDDLPVTDVHRTSRANSFTKTMSEGRLEHFHGMNKGISSSEGTVDQINQLTIQIDQLTSDIASMTRRNGVENNLEPPPLPNKKVNRLPSQYDNVDGTCVQSFSSTNSSSYSRKSSSMVSTTEHRTSTSSMGSGHSGFQKTSSYVQQTSSQESYSSSETFSSASHSSLESLPNRPPPLPPKKKHIQDYMHSIGNYTQPEVVPDCNYSRHSINFYETQWHQHQIELHHQMYPRSNTFSVISDISSDSSFSSSAPTSPAIPPLPTKRRDSEKRASQLSNLSVHSDTSMECAREKASSVVEGPTQPPEGELKRASAPPGHVVKEPVSPVLPKVEIPKDSDSDFAELNPLDDIDVSDQLIKKTEGEEGPEIRGGPVDSLVVHATSVGKQGSVEDLTDEEFMYQEAFLTTYRTFIPPHDLIDKLLYRFHKFHHASERKKKVGRNTFSLLIRVIDELSRKEMDQSTIEKMMKLVFELLCQGDLMLAKVLRKKVIEKCESIKPTPDPFSSMTFTSSITLKTSPSDFLFYKSHDIAEQMTLLDAELFQKIEIHEVSLWAREQSEELSPNLTEFTEHFNKMSYWCRTQILTHDEAKDREKYFFKFIKIMKHLRKLNNFNSYLAILSAVDSAPIRRLEWPRQNLEALKEFCQLIDSSGSFRAYRQALAETEPPCIPYIGLILQDLTFINIGNQDLLPDGSINFAKRWQQFNILDNMRRFKKCNYQIKRNEKLINCFNNFDDYLSEESLWQISEKIKPRGGNKKRLEFDS